MSTHVLPCPQQPKGPLDLSPESQTGAPTLWLVSLAPAPRVQRLRHHPWQVKQPYGECVVYKCDCVLFMDAYIYICIDICICASGIHKYTLRTCLCLRPCGIKRVEMLENILFTRALCPSTCTLQFSAITRPTLFPGWNPFHGCL